jgi:hypothetical protein
MITCVIDAGDQRSPILCDAAWRDREGMLDPSVLFPARLIELVGRLNFAVLPHMWSK